MTGFPGLLLYPLTGIGLGSRVVIISKALARSIAKSVLININPFALESIRVYKAILVLLVNSIQVIVRYYPPIRLLKSIPCKLTPRESRLESLSRYPLFLGLNYHSLSL